MIPTHWLAGVVARPTWLGGMTLSFQNVFDYLENLMQLQGVGHSKM